MKHDDLENDPLWDLLRQSPARQARPAFAVDTVRAARLASADSPWWRKALLPLSCGGFLAGAAALTIAIMAQHHEAPASGPVVTATPSSQSGSIADVQDYAESQVLAVAADHLSDYSDDELVSLIGF